MNDFNFFIQQLKAKNGILSKDLAMMIGCSRAYISAIENGKRKIPDDFYEKICSIFEFSETEKMTLQTSIVKANDEYEVNRFTIAERQKDIMKNIMQFFKMIRGDMNVSVDFIKKFAEQIAEQIKNMAQSWRTPEMNSFSFGNM